MNRALPFALLLLAACPKTETKTCTVSTCAGCCSADDRCELGTGATACGIGGEACAACGLGQSCNLGVCTLAGAGGGSASGGGSAAGGGSVTGGGSAAGGGSATGGGSASGGGGAASGGGSATGGGSSDDGGDDGGPPDSGVDGGATDGGAATLIGMTWAYLPNDGGEEQIRVIDPTTGQSSRIGSVNGLYWISYGGAVDEPPLSYLLGEPIFGPSTLYTVDLVAGTTLGAVVLDEDGGLNWSGGLHVRSDKSLLGITWHQINDGGIEELRVIDTTTGGSTLIAPLPKIDYFSSDSNVIDPVSQVIYLLAYSNADASYFVHRIDAFTGADTLSAPLGVVYPGWNGFYVRSDGQLLTLDWNGDGGVHLMAIDPSTAVATQVGNGFSLALWSGFYDRVDDRLYALGYQGFGDVGHVVVLDGFTGAVLNTFSLADDGGYGFNWSGGLHVYH